MPDSTTITNQTPKEKPVVITSEGFKKSMFKFSFVNPKILGAMTVLVLLVGGVGAGVYLTGVRQQTTTKASLSGVDLTFQPSQIQVDAASQFNVDVFTNSNDNQITGIDLVIKYDPAKLTLQSITPGQFLPKILVQPSLTAGSATISLGTEGTSGVSGNGVVAGLVFQSSSQNSQTSSQIEFNPQGTHIKVLNRVVEGASDTLGTAEVIIKPTSETNPPSPVETSPTPEPEPSVLRQPDGQPSQKTQTSTNSDFNSDGQTNSVDLSIMYSGWGDPKTEAQKKADLNGDGVVNGIDYAAFLPKFKT